MTLQKSLTPWMLLRIDIRRILLNLDTILKKIIIQVKKEIIEVKEKIKQLLILLSTP